MNNLKNEKINLKAENDTTKYQKEINKKEKNESSNICNPSTDANTKKQQINTKETITIDKTLFSGNISNWLKSAKISCKRSTSSNYEYTVYAYLIPNFGKYKKVTN